MENVVLTGKWRARTTQKQLRRLGRTAVERASYSDRATARTTE